VRDGAGPVSRRTPENNFLHFVMRLTRFCCTFFASLIVLASPQKRAQPAVARPIPAARSGRAAKRKDFQETVEENA
jgi:hypothetical protein